MNYPAHPITTSSYNFSPSDRRLRSPAIFVHRNRNRPDLASLAASPFFPMNDFSSLHLKATTEIPSSDSQTTIIRPSSRQMTDSRLPPVKTIRFDFDSKEQRHPNVSDSASVTSDSRPIDGPMHMQDLQEEPPPNKRRRFQRRNSATAAMLMSQMTNMHTCTSGRPSLLYDDPVTKALSSSVRESRPELDSQTSCSTLESTAEGDTESDEP